MRKLLLFVIVVLSMSSHVLADNKKGRDSVVYTPEGSFYKTPTPEEKPVVKTVVPPVKTEEGPRYKTVVSTTPTAVQQTSIRKRQADLWVAPKPAPVPQEVEQPTVKKETKVRTKEIYTRSIVTTHSKKKCGC